MSTPAPMSAEVVRILHAQEMRGERLINHVRAGFFTLSLLTLLGTFGANTAEANTAFTIQIGSALAYAGIVYLWFWRNPGRYEPWLKYVSITIDLLLLHMAAVIMASGVPCQVTYRAANNPYVDAQIRKSRERYGIRLFAPKGDGTRDLMAGMKRGDSIALLVDQKYNQGPEVEFFGQPVNASPGAARLALKFGTVMQPLSVVRLPGARFRVTAHEPITVRETEDKAAAVLAGIQAANRFVEDRVREVPEDWFWVHKRWPDRVYAALEAAAPSAERRNGPQ